MNRYLQRLGLRQPTLDVVLRSRLIGDIAVIAPDLFLIDGTDLTVAVPLTRSELLSGLLRLLGVHGLDDEGILELKNRSRPLSYWSGRGDILCISSHRDEIDRVRS